MSNTDPITAADALAEGQLCAACAECDECAGSFFEIMAWRCEGCVTFTCSPGCHYRHVSLSHRALGGMGAVPSFVEAPAPAGHECRSKTEARIAKARNPP